jgi:hypothetical protein
LRFQNEIKNHEQEPEFWDEGTFLVASTALLKLDRGMPILTKQVSEDPRVQVCEGVLYFEGSPDQLIALIVQDVVDAVQRKRLEELGQ